jgi:hypothetical protein
MIFKCQMEVRNIRWLLKACLYLGLEKTGRKCLRRVRLLKWRLQLRGIDLGLLDLSTSRSRGGVIWLSIAFQGDLLFFSVIFLDMEGIGRRILRLVDREF